MLFDGFEPFVERLRKSSRLPIQWPLNAWVFSKWSTPFFRSCYISLSMPYWIHNIVI